MEEPQCPSMFLLLRFTNVANSSEPMVSNLTNTIFAKPIWLSVASLIIWTSSARDLAWHKILMPSFMKTKLRLGMSSTICSLPNLPIRVS